MKTNLFLSLACTLTIFAVGAGFQRLTVEAPILAAPLEVASAPVTAAPRTTNLPVLPTVYVVADASPVEATELAGVMGAPAVGHARKALAGGLGKGARWVGMNIPYYAFAGLASRSSD